MRMSAICAHFFLTSSDDSFDLRNHIFFYPLAESGATDSTIFFTDFDQRNIRIQDTFNSNLLFSLTEFTKIDEFDHFNSRVAAELRI